MTRRDDSPETPKHLAAATMVLPVYGTELCGATDEQAAANRSIYGVDTAAEVISRYRPAGLVLVEGIPFHDGFEDLKLGMLDTSERLRCFIEEAQELASHEQMAPLLIVADQEGGVGSRLPSIALPAPAIIGRTASAELAERAGELTGRAALAHGVGVVLGPLADLDLGNAAIGDRAFSSDPAAAALLVTGWVKGVQTNGVVGVAKHWPGHGRASADSHVGTPALDVDVEHWRREERLPFSAAIEAGIAGVLIAHLTAPALDQSGALASQSSELMNRLRNGLGFEGFTMSDALWMPSARKSALNDAEVALASLNAGVDLLLAPPDPAGTGELAASAIPGLVERLDKAVGRIAVLRSNHPVVDRAIDVAELNAEIQEFNAHVREAATDR